MGALTLKIAVIIMVLLLLGMLIFGTIFY